MTDLQVRAQANIIEQQKADAAAKQAEAATQQAVNTWYRDREAARANQARELLTDLENQAKYGYDRYMPISDEGTYRRSSSWGMWQIPWDFVNRLAGNVAGVMKAASKL